LRRTIVSLQGLRGVVIGVSKIGSGDEWSALRAGSGGRGDEPAMLGGHHSIMVVLNQISDHLAFFVLLYHPIFRRPQSVDVGSAS